MKLPRMNLRAVIPFASILTLVAVSAILWKSPHASAGELPRTASYVRFSATDQTTTLIRDTDKTLVRVRTESHSEHNAASELGPIVADHDSYVIVAADHLPPTLPAGADVMETSVNLPGRSFDPLKDPPPGTIVQNSARPETGYYIVQFGVTATDELLESLRDAGSEIVQYIPHQAFIVYGSGDAIVKAAAHSRVRWTGRYLPEHKISNTLAAQLASLGKGRVSDKETPPIERTTKNLAIFDVAVFSNADLGLVAQEIAMSTGGKLVDAIKLPNNFFDVVRIESDIERIVDASKVEGVFSIESWGRPRKEDEIAAQIVAGNYTGNVVDPPGYNPLTQFGVNGQNVTVAIVDDGIGIPGDGGFYVNGGNAANAPLRGAAAGADGHGHLQASIIAGDAPYSVLDPNDYNYGIGIAPKSQVVNIPLLRIGYTGNEANTANDAVTAVGANGVLANISNNSWGFATNGNVYDSAAAQYDGFVRDASTAGSIDPLVVVFSAGNQGTAGLTRPKVAKNVISVGATENIRPTLPSSASSTSPADDLEQVPDFSSRGPAADTRIKPDIAAPGDAVTGGRSGPDVLFGNVDTFHRVSSGTSHAAPQVAGAAALFTQWWKSTNSGANPSPAMVKAALINGAVEVTGTGAAAPRPNGAEGWGRINLKNVLNTTAAMTHVDQRLPLGTVGEIRNYAGTVSDSSRPVRVSLVWTDPPGAVDPALVNDLDLEVSIGGNKYRGNVFTAGLSVTGGAADVRNNVENVFLPAGVSGPITVRVIAKALNGDGILGNADMTDQHFALVVYNGDVALSNAASPEGGQPLVVTGNNLFEPSECNFVNVPITNLGGSAMTDITATLSTNTPGVAIPVPNASYPDIAPGATANNATAFQVSTSGSVACASHVQLTLAVSYAGMPAPAIFNFTLPVGSPPAANYTFASSTGATISAGGTLVPGSSADDAVLNVSAPFAFSVYDTPVASGSTIRVSTNGQIRVESAGSTATAITNTSLPSAGGNGSPFPATLPVLLPYWDDLDLRTTTTVGGGIYTEVTGTPGSQTMKIEWRARNYFADQALAAPNVRFAVYFHEGSSSFEYVYGSTGGTGAFVSGSSATVGVQAATTGSTITQYSFNSPSLSPGLMLSATRPAGQCSAGSGACVLTSADATISGRVMTRDGRAIRGAIVLVSDAAGLTYRTRSNSFGYFRIANVPSGQTIVINASARGYSFSSQVLDLADDVSELTITATR